MTPSIPASRNRAATEARLIEAARSVLTTHGFQGLGVNAVARAARCDKQLIYRYFGGMDALVSALGEAQGARLAAALEACAPPGPAASYGDLINQLVLAYLDALDADPAAQKFMLQELTAPGPALAPFSRARTRMLAGWIARRQGRLAPPDGIDALAVNALLIAAVHQIVLARSASRAGRAGGAQDDAAWARARAALSHMVQASLSGPS
ncbi:MAG: TetR/AcrR family transcriptional regulator [Oceanicaulis sp.]|nr:TetR/AcrR family transcriptional regulator [Oceanicaulis sp.]